MQKKRSILYKNIRAFFDNKNYLEVFTPSLSDTLIPENSIYNFKSDFLNDFEGSKEMYLIPSPEIFMKRILASGSPSIYQISTCFRNNEQLSEIHNPEFTMLEYYTLNFDEEDSIKLTEELFSSLSFSDTPDYCKPPFKKMSVNEAMIKYSGINLDENQNRKIFRQNGEKLGLTIPECESWDDIFNRIFLTFVEPNLPQDKPLVLYDYPKQIECLAEERGNYRRRWELYVGGVEIANCYKEETDREKVASYYKSEYAKLISSRGDTSHAISDIDLSFCELALPPSSGVAIGVDRLLMILTGNKSISSLLTFPFSVML